MEPCCVPYLGLGTCCGPWHSDMCLPGGQHPRTTLQWSPFAGIPHRRQHPMVKLSSFEGYPFCAPCTHTCTSVFSAVPGFGLTYSRSHWNISCWLVGACVVSGRQRGVRWGSTPFSRTGLSGFGVLLSHVVGRQGNGINMLMSFFIVFVKTENESMISYLKVYKVRLGVVAHACNPSTLGG